jgi:putative hydrolase of HD superfamily
MNHASAARAVLNFIRSAERLKAELRHSWISSGRRESVAEHTWQMALLALVTHRDLEHTVDIDRVLRMVLVHDLVEAEVGDIPFFEVSERKTTKVQREQDAIIRIRDMLDPVTGAEIFALFGEYEEWSTPEAKFAKALDNLEVQIQHNLANLSTWEPIEYDLVFTKMDRYCVHDRYLRELCQAVKADAETKLRDAGVDVEEVKRRALASNPGRDLSLE